MGIPVKKAKEKKAPTSQMAKRRHRTTPASDANPTRSLSDLAKTARKAKSPFQKFESSCDLEDAKIKKSEHSGKYSENIGNVEPALVTQNLTKFRKNRGNQLCYKDSSSCSETEDDQKRHVKKTCKQKRPASEVSDLFPWIVGKEKGGGKRRKGPIECIVCGRKIKCRAIMKRHMLTHTGEKPFECKDCGRRYTSNSNLRIHQQSHTGKMDFSCDECGQKFTHLPYLKRHLLRHSGNKQHICDQCGKGFIQKYHLERHLLVHSSKMPYECDKCNASFKRTDYLRMHRRTVHQCEGLESESKAKPHKCSMCVKAFATRASLEAHGRVHTGVTPYSCTICQRKFKQSSHMRSHMRTHSGEKPHSCDQCGLKFSRRTSVQKHKQRIHASKSDCQQHS